ncbi:hypothetical protein SAMN05660668_02099 [Pseudobutyrivibrio sp. AR14]|uniref:hypothetical protein n=1 Tax=Pseudobutyrivibrio sp. AR14 TaxID=1520804 RepID=UPI000886952A|nr:hypothetical protein [Pseudobutyrivibrio sp. AR14]SCY29667.1 hypothetical protein SAMN05660668_02099 [Pseudobutyrivibrio sp. AR14]
MIFQNKRIINGILLMALVVSLCSCGKKEEQIPFSTDKWKEGFTDRYLMLEDLESNYDLIGMNDKKVEELLGVFSLKYDPDGDPNNNNYYWGYTIRYDDYEGYEVLLLQFKEDTVINVDKEYLSYL